MGRKILASLVVIVGVLALNVGTQAGAAKPTEAEITCAAYPGYTVIDWLPGQTSFTITYFDGAGVRSGYGGGSMRGGGKVAVITPPRSVSWTATVSGESLNGTCA